MAEPGFEPEAAGWEARMLPLCYAAHPRQLIFINALIALGRALMKCEPELSLSLRAELRPIPALVHILQSLKATITVVGVRL